MTRHFQTAQQYVLNTLRAEILSGLHPANTRLRQEEVAARLQVSTTPVREAFRDLRAEGLVSIGPNRGVVTRGLTATDVDEIYELRMVLEPMLAQKACLRASGTQLDAAQACHRTMLATDSPEAWSVLNEAFHEHLVACEAHTRLFAMVGALFAVARPYVALAMHVQQDIMASNNDEHAALLAAYRARDDAAVYEQTREHLKNTLAAVVRCVSGGANGAAVVAVA
ncbi:GntR family transcriptional regulator [Paraburkholderia rhizosphaerae]|uniref:GntR family transcriptional regulator n=1 Tax=Paraburkholderia rhizosphaerae TaxID=480658 RepID=A0A4R8LML9_9BURK|nr:GntR family transcriptional regulator [Paraburkholderia rhizosphaerae]TDY45386.1 GntR family transcriptional regulator [Paraburkholderia rhizosphaerae]